MKDKSVTVRRKPVVDPYGMGFKRPPQRCYSITFDDKRVSQMFFVEDKSKSMSDVLEEMKASNAKSGRIVTYKISKDGSSARWHMKYTNVKRTVSGNIKCFAERRA